MVFLLEQAKASNMAVNAPAKAGSLLGTCREEFTSSNFSRLQHRLLHLH